LQGNANDVHCKKDELLQLFQSEDVDVAVLSGMHLEVDVQFVLCNYTTYRLDRLDRRDGGVTVLVGRSLPHHPIALSNLKGVVAVGKLSAWFTRERLT
jgi:hypothetical protein